MHPLKLNCSYAMVKGPLTTRDNSGEPLATSYHSKFLGTVDYLWYSDGLAPTKVLDTLPINVLKKTGGLPYKKLGSDHLALVSEFAFLEVVGVTEDRLSIKGDVCQYSDEPIIHTTNSSSWHAGSRQHGKQTGYCICQTEWHELN